jgi:hypothetical protein
LKAAIGRKHTIPAFPAAMREVRIKFFPDIPDETEGSITLISIVRQRAGNKTPDNARTFRRISTLLEAFSCLKTAIPFLK